MTTIDNIARLAGVSPATVSKVLNNRPYVSAEVRARVERVIAETGYVPSQRARGLSQRRSYILGLLIPYTSDQLFSDPHLLECMRGIERETNGRDYNLLLSTAREPAEAASACVRLLQSDVIDAAVVLETFDLRPFVEAPTHRDLPLVLIGYPRKAAMHSVHADDYGGALQAARHLVALGHRRIGVVRSRLVPYALEERMRGIHDALAEAGLTLDESLVVAGDFSVESGDEAGRALLSREARPSAIFALNDRMALGVMRAAATLGVQVPDDLSVVGFDDIPLATLMPPALTTVRQPGFEIGQAAAALSFSLLDSATAPETIVIPTDLIVRGSTAPPAAG